MLDAVRSDGFVLRAWRQAKVRCRRVFGQPLHCCKAKGLKSVDKRESETGPAVRIGTPSWAQWEPLRHFVLLVVLTVHLSSVGSEAGFPFLLNAFCDSFWHRPVVGDARVGHDFRALVGIDFDGRSIDILSTHCAIEQCYGEKPRAPFGLALLVKPKSVRYASDGVQHRITSALIPDVSLAGHQRVEHFELKEWGVSQQLLDAGTRTEFHAYDSRRALPQVLHREGIDTGVWVEPEIRQTKYCSVTFDLNLDAFARELHAGISGFLGVDQGLSGKVKQEERPDRHSPLRYKVRIVYPILASLTGALLACFGWFVIVKMTPRRKRYNENQDKR